MTQPPLPGMPPTQRRLLTTERLQALYDALFPEENAGLDEVAIEFKPYRGWYMIGPARWFGDDGVDFIGRNWKEAEQYIKGMKR